MAAVALGAGGGGAGGGGGGAPAAAGGGGGGGGGAAAGALAMLQGLPDPHVSAVMALEQQRRDLKRQTTDATRDLTNAKKRQKRILEKAKNLSDEQLLSIVTTRAAKAQAKAKAKAKAKG